MGLLIVNLSALACVAIAAFLAFYDVTGWGWFLVPAILLCHTMGANSNRLVAASKKMLLCFPEYIPEGQEEVSFDIPAYVIEELRKAVKGATNEK